MAKTHAPRTAEHNAKIGASIKALGRGSSPTKMCVKCDQELPREDFGVRPNGYSMSYCRECLKRGNREKAMRHYYKHPEEVRKRREYNRKACLKRYYGMTIEQWEELKTRQGGLCAICGSPPPVKAKRDVLVVDHCHATGAIRGLLCDPCNHMLGSARDNIQTLRSAIRYLEESLVGNQTGMTIHGATQSHKASWAA